MGTVPALSQLYRLFAGWMPEESLFGAHSFLTDKTAVLVIYSLIAPYFLMSKTSVLEQLHLSGIFVDLSFFVCVSWNLGAQRSQGGSGEETGAPSIIWSVKDPKVNSELYIKDTGCINRLFKPFYLCTISL